MQKTDKFLAERLVWKAQQYHLPTEHSFFFDGLTSELQKSLLESIDQEISGTPVLFFTTSTNEWTLLCTRQIVWSDMQNISSLNYSEIKSVRPTELERDYNNELNLPENKKSEWKEFKVIDKNDSERILHANHGKDFFALWNILLMIYRMSYDRDDA